MYALLKKRYGQNFLVDSNITNKIAKLITHKNLNIIEIGPGDGKLTEKIFQFEPEKLILIEIDKDLIPFLETKFGKRKNIKIYNQDILSYEFQDDLELIISNLPYNISSQILVKICLLEKPPKRLILMFQKEFADRLLDKKINSLNSLISCFFDIKKEFNVSKNCFKPIPKVDSSVLSFERKEVFLIQKKEIDNYIMFKRKIFSQKRKSLKNLLKDYKSDFSEYDLRKRVEEISLEKLIDIFRKINF